MPLLEVTLSAGHDPKALRGLIDQVHNAVVVSIGAKPESVRVIIREVPRTHWAAGNVTLAERDEVSGEGPSVRQVQTPLDGKKE